MALVLGLIVFFALVALVCRAPEPDAPWYLRVIPLLAYPFYRFSGSLTVLACVGAAWYAPHDGDVPQRLFWFAVPGCLFLALAFAKLTIVVLTSSNNRWWMLLLKANFAIGAVVWFPVGLLALACYWWFEHHRVQDRGAKRRAASRWDHWRYERSHAVQRDSPSHQGNLVPWMSSREPADSPPRLASRHHGIG